MGGRMAKKGHYLLLSGLSLIFIVANYHIYSTYIRSTVRSAQNSIFVYCDEQFSQACAHDLTAYTLQLNTCSPKHIAQQIHKKFPIVARVQVTQRAHFCSIRIEPPMFKCIVNQTHILDHTARAYDSTLITDSLRALLPVIQTNNSSTTNSLEFQEFLRNIPQDYLYQYHTTWYTPYDIALVADNQPYTIHMRYDQSISHELLQNIAYAYSHAHEKAPKKRLNKVDVRFNAQIIIGAHTGG